MKSDVLGTLGTPLVRVSSPAGTTIAAKLESRNPGGSTKDRPALYMVEAAERAGALEPGGHLVEPTSGNTGIGLAIVAAVKGYDLTLVMPEGKSVERRRLMRAYGADIELTPGSDIATARERAGELEAEEGMVQLRQFENPANVDSHYETTAAEILQQTDRPIDAFVATVGTGGTITGIGHRLREADDAVEIVAVEPAENPVLSTGEAGSDDYQGMGPGFVADILDVDMLDRVETVRLEAAEAECRRLAREEGILVGQSSGAAHIAARRTAERLLDAGGAADEDDGPLVVTVFPDSGERYLTTGTFDIEG